MTARLLLLVFVASQIFAQKAVFSSRVYRQTGADYVLKRYGSWKTILSFEARWHSVTIRSRTLAYETRLQNHLS